MNYEEASLIADCNCTQRKSPLNYGAKINRYPYAAVTQFRKRVTGFLYGRAIRLRQTLD